MDAVKEKLGALRVQDLLLTTVCILFIYLLRTKNHFVLAPAWHKHMDTNLYSNGKYPNAEEMLPQPIVTDFEGDGVMEVLFISNTLELQVAKYASSQSANSKQLPQLDAQYTVQLPVVKDEDGRRGFPVSMETGYVEEYLSSVQVRAQVSKRKNRCCTNNCF